MKKTILWAFLFGLLASGYGNPTISDVTFPNAVNLFDLYEITFQLGTYTNPYDPAVIDVFAEFMAPDGTISKVNGFYHEGYRFELYHGYEKPIPDVKNNGWKVRFTPRQEGVWRFTLYAIDKKGKTVMTSYASTAFTFRCMPVSSAVGFITMANTRYLKREIVSDGRRCDHSFFPIGPNVAWYICKSYYNYATPYGIYEYERRIDSLAGNANYMRIFLDRSKSISLYGPEHTQIVNDAPTIYFNTTINQKDAAEVDHIIHYAAQNDINVMLCFFNCINLMANLKQNSALDKTQDGWLINPYHTVLGLKTTIDFFTDAEARHISKNLIRYIVARWGYATNLVAWELWNEVTNIDFDSNAVDHFRNSISSWHKEMTDYIRDNDPFGHPISTSLGHTDPEGYLYDHIFNTLDFVMHHNYFNVQDGKSKQQPSYQMFLRSVSTRKLYPTKPFFIGEFAFGNLNPNKYFAKDPFGIDLHNSLWSTMFSGMMAPASFWQWAALEKCGIHKTFKPLLTFCNQLPILSETFVPYTTSKQNPKVKYAIDFPNGIKTYYMVNAAEDTLYGWSQDTAFTYQALRRLTDKVGSNKHFKEDEVFDPNGYVYTLNAKKRPRPSSKSNIITLPLEKQPAGTSYIVRWFDSETGSEIVSEATKVVVKNNALTFEFPSSIRDVRKKTVSNNFGDAVFIITLDQYKKNTGSIFNKNATGGKLKIRKANKNAGRQ